MVGISKNYQFFLLHMPYGHWSFAMGSGEEYLKVKFNQCINLRIILCLWKDRSSLSPSTSSILKIIFKTWIQRPEPTQLKII